MGAFDDLFDDGADKIRANAALRFGIEAQPDAAARDQTLARRYGLPPGVIEQYRPDYETRAKVEDAAPTLEQSPKLRGWLADDMSRAQVVHDDLSNMGAVEAAVKYLVSTPDAPRGGLVSDAGRAVSALASGLPSAGGGLYGAAAAPFELLGQIPGAGSAADLGGWLRRQQQSADAVSKSWLGMSPDAGIVEQGVMSGLQSAGQNLAMLPLGLTSAGETAMLGAMGVITGGQSYGKGRDAGLSPAQAIPYAAEDAAAEVITEKFLGAAGFLKQIKAGSSAGKLFAYEVGKEVPGEIAATLWQNFNEWANINPDKSVTDFLAEQPAAVAQTVIATLVGGGVQIGAVKGVERVMRGADANEQRAQRAEQTSQILEQMHQLAAASKVLQRDPETFQQFVQHAAEDGEVHDIYIGAQVLMQSGAAEQLAQVSPAIAEQLPAALATGGDIRIPVAEYAARIAPTEYAQSLLDHLKTDPDGFSRAEAHEYMQTQGDSLQRDVERVLTEHQGDQAWRQAVDDVKQQVLDELNSAGRTTPAVNEHYATLIAARTATRAAQLGMTPEALWDRQRLGVRAGKTQAAPALVGGPLRVDNTYTDQGSTFHRLSILDGGQPVGSIGLKETASRVVIQGAGIDVAESRGKGLGIAAYARIADYALAAGKQFVSDGEVSPDAARMYQALERRGYRVERANGVEALDDGTLATNHRSVPVFRVTAGPAQTLNQSAALPATIDIDGQQRSTTNSKGQQIAATEEGVRNFWKWFGDSKVADDQGRPLVVYHGTKADAFDQFDPDLIGTENYGHDAGFWFTTSVSQAHAYADPTRKQAKKQNIMEVYLRSESPREANPWTEAERIAEQIGVADQIDTSEWSDVSELLQYADWVQDELKSAEKAGNDGLRVIESEDAPGGVGRDDHWVVFDPEQIKSATNNNGAFDPANPSILNQSAGPSANAAPTPPRGTYNPATNLITLLQHANLSTFLHEAGHYFFESDIALASDLLAAQREGASSTEGERQLLADVSALLRWHGLQGDLAEQLATWHSMPFEERRGLHERTAESFEHYLFSGQAPSIELQRPFQHFRAWLLQAYTSIKRFLVGHPEAGALNDEVRAVFDHMLATNEQIKLAEQARSMLPLFASPEQGHMTPEEFARYQSLGVDATNDAIQDLQAKGLRDLAWTRGARSREIRRLQREAAGRRAEMKIEARREVMSQPVYRAWQFLTGKQERADLLGDAGIRADHLARVKVWRDSRAATLQAAQERAEVEVWEQSPEGRVQYRKPTTRDAARRKVLKRDAEGISETVAEQMAEWDKANPRPADPLASSPSNPDVVDPARDSLFTAIAKLGGLARDQVESQWGVDPKEKMPQPVFGRPILRREGGLSLDAMVERLVEEHYLLPDESGKGDVRDLEERFDAERRGEPVYSMAYDYSQREDGSRAGDGVDLESLGAGRLDANSLGGIHPEAAQALKKRKMTSTLGGLHPDLVAELFGFSSGDEMAQALAGAVPPREAIDALTDQRMLQEHGELATPDAIERAADVAIHNEARARMVAAEADALAKAAAGGTEQTGTSRTGKPVMRSIMPRAARDFAAQLIARLKIRDIRPGQYAAAEVRAAKAAEKASRAGDLATAAAEKRNQLINTMSTQAAYAAQDEVDTGVRYLKKFDRSGTRKSLDRGYLAQIDMLLEKYDLRSRSGKSIDRAASLRTWVQSRLAAGEVPAISEALLSPAERSAYHAQIESRDENGNLVYGDDAERVKLLADAIERSARRPYKELTVEEFRGLLDTVRQIEHLARLKDRMLSSKEAASFEATRDALAAAVVDNAKQSGKNTRTDNTWIGKRLDGLKQFGVSHIKPATWMRIFDGGHDGGPWWSTIMRPANERASFETSRRAQATEALMAALGPVLKDVPALDKIGKGRHFPELGEGVSLNWEERFAFALNYGNESNLQRLMDGGIAGVTKSLSQGQIQAVLRSLTAAEWRAAQAVWDHFETYRPEIAAKELRVNGVEPEWIAARPFVVQTADGQTLQLRGGYYPVKFDRKTSLQAQQHADAQDAKDAMKAAYSAATTQRSFTKSRVEEVKGRPLLLNLQGLYSGVNDVIHDLAWHEWVIDVNRLLRDEKIDAAVREHYGANVKTEITKWRDDIVAGSKRLDHGIENAAGWARRFVSSAALTYNVMSAILQPLGITQSFARVGTRWVGQGVAEYLGDPVEATARVKEQSEFMRNRTRTMFRDLNELRNRVAGQTTARELQGRYGYFLTMHCQMMVDVPTWLGAQARALAEGHADDVAVALADQAVKDSQGGGEEVDQAGITRGGPLVKLFTAFYDFMNTQANVLYLANATRSSRADAFMKFALVGVATPILGAALKAALTPGDSGDWDNWDKIWRKMLSEGLQNLIGMVAFGREFGVVAKTLLGDGKGQGYSGPTGLRIIPDSYKLAQQAKQGELDDAFRKAFVSELGDVSGIPAVQINRSVTGAKALHEGKTSNPAALVFGFEEPH